MRSLCSVQLPHIGMLSTEAASCDESMLGADMWAATAGGAGAAAEAGPEERSRLRHRLSVAPSVSHTSDGHPIMHAHRTRHDLQDFQMPDYGRQDDNFSMVTCTLDRQESAWIIFRSSSPVAIVSRTCQPSSSLPEKWRTGARVETTQQRCNNRCASSRKSDPHTARPCTRHEGTSAPWQ